MGNKRARDRQLAKLAARRQAERRAKQRRRSRIVAGTVIVAIALAVGGVAVLAGGDDTPAAPSTSAGASPTTAPAASCSTKVPKAAAQERPTFDRPPKMTIDTKATYTATIETSCGTIEAELLPDVAPIGVNSFVFLADQGFYDGLTFHRVVQDFVIQGGDPKGDGTGGPGYEFENETSPKVTFDAEGVLAYANSGPDTNGSQFFVTLGPQPSLDPTPDASYTIFGRVTKGMKVVTKIGSLIDIDPATGQQVGSAPSQTVYIDSITIERSG